MTCILKYLSILTFPCLCWGGPFSKAVLHPPVPDLTCLVKLTILPKDLAVLLHKCQHCSPIAPFHFHGFDDNQIFQLAVFVLGLFPFDAFCFDAFTFKLWVERPKGLSISAVNAAFRKILSHPQIVLEIEKIYIVFRSRLTFFSFHTFLREIVILDHY